MDATHGREEADLNALLTSQTARCSLGQALRLLTLAQSDTDEERREFLQHRVRMRPWLSLAFPATELERIKLDATPVELSNTFFGLYSTLGPLPTFYTEDLLEEERNDESVVRDFLDIINQHLNYYLHLATLFPKLARKTEEQHNPLMQDLLHALMAQAHESLRPEGPPQVAVLPLMAQRVKSAQGLENYLAWGLRLRDVVVEQAVEARVALHKDQRCVLGMQACTLGEDATIGSYITDFTGKFRIHLHNLAEDVLRDFLPGGARHEALRLSVARYSNLPLQYDVVLHPCEQAVSPLRLGETSRMGSYVTAFGPANLQPVTVFYSQPAHGGQD